MNQNLQNLHQNWRQNYPRDCPRDHTQNFQYNLNEQNYRPTNLIQKTNHTDIEIVARENDTEGRLTLVQRVKEDPGLKPIFEYAKAEGELEALKAMYTRLRNLKIGTNEVEEQMRKIVMNGILRGNDKEAKGRGKYEQKRDIKTIEDLMNNRIWKINNNIKSIKRTTEMEIRKLVENESKVLGGNRNRKIRLFRVEARATTYNKQIKQCERKIDDLKKKHAEKDPKTQNDEQFLENITWRDKDLQHVPKIDPLDCFTTVGNIQPPLTNDQVEALALGPNFCLTPDLPNEPMEVSLGENKVKRIWNDMSEKYVFEDDDSDNDNEEETPEELDARMRRVYDFDKNEINMGNLRVTDTKFNRRTILPENRNKRIEAQENIRKENTMRTFQNYKLDKCDAKGKVLNKNITKNAERGLKSLKKRVTEGTIYISRTDKSGKIAVITMEEYIRMGEVHTKDDKVITEKELHKIQTDLNRHAASFLNIFNVGETHGERNVSRINSAFTSKACATPPLWLMPKDHKVRKEGDPMPSRPVVGIATTMLARCSNLASTILKRVADRQKDSLETKSRENLQAVFTHANSRLRK